MPRDALLYAVAKAQAEKAIHHVENCPKCRHALKIQVAELKRRIPPNTPLPEYIPPVPVEAAPPPAKPAPATSTPTPAPEPAKEIVEVKESVESKKTKETVEIKEKKVAPKEVEEVKPKKAATKTKTVEKKTTTKKK